MASSIREAVVGSLTTLAAGDCLGLPVEGWRPEDIRAVHGVVRSFAWEKPVWSDDTQQALILIEVFVRDGRITPERVGEALVDSLAAHPGRRFGLHRGTGRGFRHAVSAFRRDRDWRTSADAERVGNGAAMRISPLATCLHDVPDVEFVRAIIDASVVTHRDARSLTAALAVARAAQFSASREMPLDGGILLSTLADSSEADAAGVERALGHVLAGADHLGDAGVLLRRLAEMAGDGGDREDLLSIVEANAMEVLGSGQLATAGWALASPIAAIVVAASATDVEDALVTAVNLGGDADTMGAMVGGIVGAASGSQGLPERLRHFPGYDALVQWAEAAAEGMGVGSLPDLEALERELCNIRDGA
jgi:ADP-ribosyl-[dinitrogen reductase] hydrolase